MQDDQQKQGEQAVDQQQVPQQAEPQGGILNQTFGELLQNKDAQEQIMKSMHIGPEQFQKLLKSTEGNPITNMSVGQLFKSGFVQQAVKAQGGNMPSMEQVPQQGQPEQASSEMVDQQQQVVDQSVDPSVSSGQDEQELEPEQFQQLVASGNAQVLETDEMGNPTKIAVQQEQPQPESQKQSWWDIVKSAFK